MYSILSMTLLYVTSYDRERLFIPIEFIISIGIILNIKKARHLCRSRASIKLFFYTLASDRHLNSGGGNNGNVLIGNIHGE